MSYPCEWNSQERQQILLEYESIPPSTVSKLYPKFAALLFNITVSDISFIKKKNFHKLLLLVNEKIPDWPLQLKFIQNSCK